MLSFHRLPFFVILFCLLSAGAAHLRAEDVAPLSDSQVEELQHRFGRVKAWRVSFSYAGQNPYSWTEQGTHHVRTEWSETSEGHFVLPVTSSGDTSMQAFGEGPSHDTMHRATVSTTPPGQSETRYDDADGNGRIRVELELDLTTGTYVLSLLDQEFPSIYGGSTRDANGIRSYGPSAGRTHVILPQPGSDGRALRLPAKGTELRGRLSVEDYVNALARQTNGFDRAEYARDQPVQGVLEWTLTPAALEPTPKPTLPPSPTPVPPIVDPTSSEASPNNPADDIVLEVDTDPAKIALVKNDARLEANAAEIAFRATLVSPTGRPLTHRARSMTFALLPAQTTPRIGSSTTATPGLGRFPAERNAGATIDPDGHTARFTQGPYVSVTATLATATAHGPSRLIVTARLDDGRVLVGRSKVGQVDSLLLVAP